MLTRYPPCSLPPEGAARPQEPFQPHRCCWERAEPNSCSDLCTFGRFLTLQPLGWTFAYPPALLPGSVRVSDSFCAALAQRCPAAAFAVVHTKGLRWQPRKVVVPPEFYWDDQKRKTRFVARFL